MVFFYLHQNGMLKFLDKKNCGCPHKETTTFSYPIVGGGGFLVQVVAVLISSSGQGIPNLSVHPSPVGQQM